MDPNNIAVTSRLYLTIQLDNGMKIKVRVKEIDFSFHFSEVIHHH